MYTHFVYDCKSERKQAIVDTEYRINSQIRAKEVRLIIEEESESGPPTTRNIGVVTLREALDTAASYGVDLVEVAPDANPPVCKVMDFGKFQYEQQRKVRRSKKNQQKVEIKTIQLRPKTGDHHIEIALKRARGWLEEGKKVKVKMQFRGREITHSQIGREKLDELKEQLSDVGVVEQSPNMDGRDMIMVLAPNKE